MDTTYTELFASIREKCQRDGWYGGELDSPTSLHVRPDHPQRVSFAYSPASEEQLQATETALGFPLPPLLRTLYAEDANGGFGPGAGIQGALGLYSSPSDEPARTIVEEYHFRSQIGYASTGRSDPIRLIDLADYAQHWKPTPSGKELLLLPLCGLADAAAPPRRFGMLSACLPGLQDWPCALHSPERKRRGV